MHGYSAHCMHKIASAIHFRLAELFPLKLVYYFCSLLFSLFYSSPEICFLFDLFSILIYSRKCLLLDEQHWCDSLHSIKCFQIEDKYFFTKYIEIRWNSWRQSHHGHSHAYACKDYKVLMFMASKFKLEHAKSRLSM